MPEDDDIDLRIESPQWRAALADCDGFVRRALTAAMQAERAGGAVAVLLSDDATLQALNAQWRGKDKPTNVLSFPAPAGFGLGDIAMAFETVEREALEQRKSLPAHTAHLLVHGLLHLLDYDHEDDQDAMKMESREREILATLGFADPYAIEAAG